MGEIDLDLGYFRLHELVSSSDLANLGTKSVELLSREAITMLNSVRDLLGVPITVNNWYWGGNRQHSGFRNLAFYSSTSAYLKSRSQHKYGRAFDCVFKGMTVREAIVKIIKNHDMCPLVSFIEIDQGWLHVDCRINRCGSPLVLWSPSRGYVTIEQYLKENE